ncbi:MAG TPA: hypothetical protein DEP38_08255 [Cyanobacteria bacterium UBA9226]|nr:hypothetical protein [Cyanobacteria bacterium UBA9226]
MNKQAMKLYYNQQQQRYEVSELGKLIDHDKDMAALMTRNGWANDELPSDFNGDDQLRNEEITALFEQLEEVCDEP